MVFYDLMDEDGNIFNLNGVDRGSFAKNSLTYREDSIEWEHQIVEKTSGVGSQAMGESRLKSKNITLEYMSYAETMGDLREKENNLISFLSKTTYLVDSTDGIRTEVRIQTYDFTYDVGQHKLGGSGEISFILLKPFWEALTEQELSYPVVASVLSDIDLTILGSAEIQPIFEISTVTPALCDLIEIYLNYTDVSKNIGIEVQDPVFGAAYGIMTIDCGKGEIKSTIDLPGIDLDRIQYLTDGYGFFNIPSGESNLRIYASDNCTVKLKYRPRYYV